MSEQNNELFFAQSLAGYQCFLYAHQRHDILCLEYIFKTVLATVMKFHGWIDFIKAECSAHEP